ncbi:MAG: cation transporter, partial [Burkholderiales bacterium]|nr:cation transporter [Anaerolineae bacterium]
MSAKDTGERWDWTVTGMDCASCATKITTALNRLPGVEDVQVGVMSERLTVSLDANQTSRETI